GYGQGLVPSPESQGLVEMALGGSFEPGKLFTLTAYVNDPGQGQSLQLVLPEGMALVEGPEVQAVPAPPEGQAASGGFLRARGVGGVGGGGGLGGAGRPGRGGEAGKSRRGGEAKGKGRPAPAGAGGASEGGSTRR